MSSPDHARPYATLSRRYLWQSRWYSLRQDQLRGEDGTELTYTVIEKPDAVWIIPVTYDRQVVLIEQYRYAVDAWCLEVPAGNIEPGADPVGAAARELREEVGGVADVIEPIARFYTMNGIGTEMAHVFVAWDVSLEQAEREPSEHIRLKTLSVDEALPRARSGTIDDGPSALALLLSEGRLLAKVAEGAA